MNLSVILGALFGLMLLKLPGAIIGALLGYWFSKRLARNFDMQLGRWNGGRQPDPKVQAEFYYALFAVMGHIAKSTGRVTEQDIALAEQLMTRMQLTGAARQQAQEAYRLGKQTDFPLRQVVRRFRQVCRGQTGALRFFIEMQIQAALHDGVLAPSEQKILLVIAQEFGIPERHLQRLFSMWQAEQRFANQQTQASTQDQLKQAYQVLGVKADVSSRELKRAYRKLMAQHHPDKLMSQGIPAEALEVAKQRTQDIQAAYDLISKQTTRKP